MVSLWARHTTTIWLLLRRTLVQLYVFVPSLWVVLKSRSVNGSEVVCSSSSSGL